MCVVCVGGCVGVVWVGGCVCEVGRGCNFEGRELQSTQNFK